MISHQSFSNIKNNGFYVDKTKEIYSLIKAPCVLLVRPRKFGKSLLVSTLYELFSGNKELFKDTYIYNTDYDFAKYKVVSFNLHLDVTRPSELAIALRQMVKNCAQIFGITLSADKPDELLRELLYSFNEKVVVLIDNYDFVLADNITNPEIEQLDQLLSRFLSVLNDQNHFKFVFLTGINHFLLCEKEYGTVLDYEDYTHRDEVAGICGFSADELKIHYANKISNLSSKNYVKAHGFDEFDTTVFSHSKISEIYAEYIQMEDQRSEELISIIMKTLGGYRFSSKSMNLASSGFVLEFLRGNGIFDLNYDLRCARGYIIKKLRDKIFSIEDYTTDLMDLIISCGPHYSYRPQLCSLLLHNGILTIEDYDLDSDDVECKLKVSNLEVQNFLDKRL